MTTGIETENEKQDGVGATNPAPATGLNGQGQQKLMQVALDKLSPNPWQPRRNFNQAKLVELAEDIRVNGLLQPVVVRVNLGDAGGYQIAAGERRWRAFKLLLEGYNISGPAVEDEEGNLVPGNWGDRPADTGVAVTLKAEGDSRFANIPVLVRILNDEDMMRIALSENEKRRDVQPIEEALAFKKMIADLGISQSEFARRMGIKQPTVANRLRMLQLPSKVQDFLVDGKLSQWDGMKLLELANKHKLNAYYLELIATRVVSGTKLSEFDHSYNFVWNLFQKLQVRLFTVPEFNVKENCADCPFFHGDPTSIDHKLCANPGHFDHLNQEAAAERRRRERELKEVATKKAAEGPDISYDSIKGPVTPSIAPDNSQKPGAVAYTLEEVNERHARHAEARARQLEQIGLENELAEVEAGIEKLEETKKQWGHLTHHQQKQLNQLEQRKGELLNLTGPGTGTGPVINRVGVAGPQEVMEADAEAARTQQWPERDENGVLILPYYLDRNKHERFDDYKYNGFSREECKECEFYTRNRDIDGSPGFYFCRKPSHFEELRARHQLEVDKRMETARKERERKEQEQREARLKAFRAYCEEGPMQLGVLSLLDRETARLIARMVMTQIQGEQFGLITKVQNWLAARELDTTIEQGTHNNYHRACTAWIDKELDRIEGKGNYDMVVITAVACVVEVYLTNSLNDNAIPLWIAKYLNRALPAPAEAEAQPQTT